MIENSRKNKSCSAWPVHSASYERHATRRKRELELVCECVFVQYKRYNLIRGLHCGRALRKVVGTVLINY
jgi:hypothetical protein